MVPDLCVFCFTCIVSFCSQAFLPSLSMRRRGAPRSSLCRAFIVPATVYPCCVCGSHRPRLPPCARRFVWAVAVVTTPDFSWEPQHVMLFNHSDAVRVGVLPF